MGLIASVKDRLRCDQEGGEQGNAQNIHSVSGSQTRLARASKYPWFVGLTLQISTFLIVVGAPQA
jgi:hypothetical protein